MENTLRPTQTSNYQLLLKKFELVTLAQYKRNRKVSAQLLNKLALDIGKAVALSVVNRCIDPQRKNPSVKLCALVTCQEASHNYINPDRETYTDKHGIEHSYYHDTNSHTVTKLIPLDDNITFDSLTDGLTDSQKATFVDKVTNGGVNKSLVKLRNEILHDTALLTAIDILHAQAYRSELNRDGYLTTKVVDRKAKEQADKVTAERVGDGVELVDEVYLALLDAVNELRQHTARCFDYGFLTNSYNKRQLKKRVRIKDEDNANGWETKETTPIQEVYKCVRRLIMNNRAVENSSQYTYIEDLATDPQTNATEVVYQRLHKYADLGGGEYLGSYSPSGDAVEIQHDTDEILEKLNLTARQLVIIEYRLQGYGDKAIATYLGIKKETVKKQRDRIGKKAIEKGILQLTHTKAVELNAVDIWEKAHANGTQHSDTTHFE